jgi:hypothetical protein
VGEGTLFGKIWDALNQVHQLRTKAYYVGEANIYLFSPQQLSEECNNDIFITFSKSNAKLDLDDGRIMSFRYQRNSNIPMMLKNKHFDQREANVTGLAAQESLIFSTEMSVLMSIAN